MYKSSGYIALGEESLHYISMGSGRKLLLTFHGYGNNAQLFMPFAYSLGREYTIVSVDLPHHGKSHWPEDKQLTTRHLKELVHVLRRDYGQDKLSLMGYSIGGRVCLKIAEMMPAHVERSILLAPDGLVFNSLYYFLTRTYAGSNVFRSFLKKPARYMPLLNMARNKKWVDESRYKFAMRYLQTTETRELLLKVWPCMSKLIPDTARLRRVIGKYKIPVDIFMGGHDRIIPVAHAQKFKKELNTVQLHILEKGHSLLDPDTMPVMAQCLLS